MRCVLQCNKNDKEKKKKNEKKRNKEKEKEKSFFLKSSNKHSVYLCYIHEYFYDINVFLCECMISQVVILEAFLKLSETLLVGVSRYFMETKLPAFKNQTFLK